MVDYAAAAIWLVITWRMLKLIEYEQAAQDALLNSGENWYRVWVSATCEGDVEGTHWVDVIANTEEEATELARSALPPGGEIDHSAVLMGSSRLYREIDDVASGLSEEERVGYWDIGDRVSLGPRFR